MRGQGRRVLFVSRSIVAKDRTISGFSFTSAAGIATLVTPEGNLWMLQICSGVSFTDAVSFISSVGILEYYFWSQNRLNAFFSNVPFDFLVKTLTFFLKPLKTNCKQIFKFFLEQADSHERNLQSDVNFDTKTMNCIVSDGESSN